MKQSLVTESQSYNNKNTLKKERKKEKKKAGRNGRDLYDAYWEEGNQRERGAETRKFIRDVNKPHTK